MQKNMVEPSEELKLVFEKTIKEAKNLNHEYVTLEHLLFAAMCSENLYNILKGFGAHFGQGFANQRMPKNKDIKIGYEIDFVDIFTGKSDTISYKLPNGNIEFLEIKIPPGIRHGDNIKFQGYGDHSIQSLPRGDLIMQVRIRPNPKFRREHNDVYTQSTVNVFDLIVGTKHDVKTPDNKNISLTIPPGTTPNTVFSVAGHGIPDISTNKRGNLFVEVKCKIPKYDKHTIEKIKQFREKNI